MAKKQEEKSKLPEPLYFCLADAAAELGCTTSKLLHFAAIGKLELCLRVDDDDRLLCFPPQWVMDAAGDPDEMGCQIVTDFGALHLEGNSLILELKKGTSILALPVSMARKIEKGFADNRSHYAEFLSLPRNYAAGLAVHFKTGEKILAYTDEIDHLFNTDSTFYSAFSLDGFTFTASDVVITAKELDLLRHGGEAVPEEPVGQEKERPAYRTFLYVVFHELLAMHQLHGHSDWGQVDLINHLFTKHGNISGLSISGMQKMMADANKMHKKRQK